MGYLRLWSVVGLSGLGVLCAGCQPTVRVKEDEPSYAELVEIYNLELETLDRLEKKRQDLIDAHTVSANSSGEEALKVLGGVLGSVAGDQGEGAADVPADPQDALDQAIANAEKVEDIASQMLETTTRALADEGEETLQLDEETKAELEKLDQDIAQQKERVERARQERDAAEAKRKSP
jgi:hypothetical protein